MFCFHKFGEIKEGYQTCIKCGKSIAVKCNHKWKRIRESKLHHPINTSMIIGYNVELECEYCGDITFKSYRNVF